MNKHVLILFVFIAITVVSCQKEYVCFCTNANSGVSSFKERYVGTIFAKKTADKSCKLNMNTETDSLTNCHIE